MAYLKRTSTSTGNRRVLSVSLWFKQAGIGQNQRFYTTQASAFRLDASNNVNFFDTDNGDGIRSGQSARDTGAWSHYLFVYNSTLKTTDDDRVRIYKNGAQITDFSNQFVPVNINTLSNFNIAGREYLIGNTNPSENIDGEVSDFFVVDGQALTPDVFGFYKDGNGYISAGSTQATDFKPGQWVPKSPSVIKNVINNSGGFGANGFYLPMNDSSNFGADFHCDPNSIITLKGEDLPQPRNGAPTTSDAYVSQLRTDPYAANLVLAVPGISTTSNTNLIDNGNFETGDFTNWTLSGTTTPTIVDGGALLTTGAAADGDIWQSTGGKATSGKWVIRWTIRSNSAGFFGLYLNNSGSNGSGGFLAKDNITTSGSHYYEGSITAVEFRHRAVIGSAGVIDNIELIALQTNVKDYSADIKGSGTNKTLTSNGTAGIDIELGNYYGSAMTFPGIYNNNIALGANTDFSFGTGDFTVELWLNTNSSSRQRILSSTQVGFVTDTSWVLRLEPNNQIAFYSFNPIDPSPTPVLAINQWHHVAVTREGLLSSLYLNGVCVGIDTNDTKNYTEAGTNNFWLSSGYTIDTSTENFDGYIQDLRIYKGVAKYKGGFDVPKPYTPVGIESWRSVSDTCSNNFATFNSLASLGSASITYSEGNLNSRIDAQAWNSTTSTIAVGSGKYYAEFSVSDNQYPRLGVIDSAVAQTGIGVNSDPTNLQGPGAISWGGFGTELFINSSTGSGDGTGYDSGDVIGIAFDADTRKVWFSKNNVWQNFTGSGANPATGTNPAGTLDGSDLIYFGARPESTNVFANFGQNPSFGGRITPGTNTDSNGKGLFKYAPPTGFLALCEDNLPAPAIADPGDYMRNVLWTGDGNDGHSITGVGFRPDFVWVKSTNTTAWNHLIDSVRGVGKILYSNATAAEINDGSIISFDSDGFTCGNTGGINGSNQDIVTWCWKAGGAAVPNTDGTLTSQVSANQTAGFSIITVDNLPVLTLTNFGHGLNKKPDFIIFKSRNNATNWEVYHSSLTPDGERKLYLNTTSAEIDSGFMGDTPPTSSLIYYNAGASTSNQIVYCWTEIEGFSKFGSYVGNGRADGPFVYCGFKPAWVMTKRTDDTSNWLLHDCSRDSVNPVMGALYANTSDVEARNSARIDSLSNGFKNRNSDGGASNNYNGGNYIFAAFAESPFQTANAK